MLRVKVHGWLGITLVVVGCAASIPASTPMSTAAGVAAPERAAQATVVKADSAEAPAATDHTAMMGQMGDMGQMMGQAGQMGQMAGMPENCPMRKAQALSGATPKRCPLSGRALTP